LEHIEKHPEFVQPDFRRNEVLSMLNEGNLEDLSVSRTKLKWGIPCPFDKEHVIYVWFDALLNYISGAGYGWDEKHFKQYWPADIHIIGKDILKFHAIIWPAMLLAADVELPKTVFAHGWLTIKSEKISKSRGNAINPLELKQTYGLDAVKYFLLREFSFGLDGDYNEGLLRERYINELSNELGNLLNRTITMIEKYSDSKIPKAEINQNFKKLCAESQVKIDKAYEECKFNVALAEIWKVLGEANKYINDNAPWEMAKKKETEKLNEILYNLSEVLRISSIWIAPVLVDSSASICAQLGIEKTKSFDDAAKYGAIKAGTKIGNRQILFRKIE